MLLPENTKHINVLAMLGAIIGDIIGSVYEFNNKKQKDFHLFTPMSRFTDDTVMTLAVAEWLTEDKEHSEEGLVLRMQDLGMVVVLGGGYIISNHNLITAMGMGRL